MLAGSMSVKDIVNTKDVRTTFGAIPYRDNVPDHDAVAVARLRAAGAITLGKLNMTELALGTDPNDPKAYPRLGLG